VSCAKTAEPIDLPFGLWTRVGPRKHKFNRVRRHALMGGHIGAIWRIRLNHSSAAAMRPYVKLLWSLVITFLVEQSWGEMYIGHGSLCVYMSVCVSICPSPHSHTTARTRM